MRCVITLRTLRTIRVDSWPFVAAYPALSYETQVIMAAGKAVHA